MLLSHDRLCELVSKRVITNVSLDHINSSSIDITLGNKILYEVPKADYYGTARLVTLADRDELMMKEFDLNERPYLLQPGEFILAQSEQFFDLPLNISAEYKLKSSMARIGLEHLTAGWCFLAGTKVPMLDGTEKNIEDIKVGDEVYSFDLNAEQARAGKVLFSGETAKVLETVVITLDNGESFECTPNHLIMTRQGDYVRADSLRTGNSLMPLYRKITKQGYEKIYNPHLTTRGKWRKLYGRWEYTHVMMTPDLPENMVRHHRDHNPLNNSTANIEFIGEKEHIALHNNERNKTETIRQLASHNARIRNQKLWSDPEFRKRHAERSSKRMIEINKKKWANNHKVVSIQKITHYTPVPVYDITVDKYHNFAISAGVFVHNCDAGWNGSVLTLELKNMTQHHMIKIQKGDRIGQVVFFEHAPVPHERSYAARGRYNGDKEVKGIKP